jgi:hypothetical protein
MCRVAVSGALSWPTNFEQACAAMRLCANEANLTPVEQHMLSRAIRELPDCAEP